MGRGMATSWPRRLRARSPPGRRRPDPTGREGSGCPADTGLPCGGRAGPQPSTDGPRRPVNLYDLWIEIISRTWSRITFDMAVGVIAALLATVVVGFVLRAVAARRGWPQRSVRRMRRPFRVLLVVLAAWAGFDAALLAVQRGGWDELFAILAIAAGAWFASMVVSFLVDIGLARYRTDVADNRAARRVRTQILVIRRV